MISLFSDLKIGPRRIKGAKSARSAPYLHAGRSCGAFAQERFPHLSLWQSRYVTFLFTHCTSWRVERKRLATRRLIKAHDEQEHPFPDLNSFQSLFPWFLTLHADTFLCIISLWFIKEIKKEVI